MFSKRLAKRKSAKVCLVVILSCVILVQLIYVYRNPLNILTLPLKITPRLLYENALKKLLQSNQSINAASVKILKNKIFVHNYSNPSLVDKSKSGSPFGKTPNGALTSHTFTKNSVVEKGDWKEGTFCHQFLVNTLQQTIPVCDNSMKTSLSSVKCYGSHHSGEMSSCILENVVVSPQHLAEAMWDADNVHFNKWKPSIALLGDCETDCHNLHLNELAYHAEVGDYLFQVINQTKEGKLQETSVCEQWIENDVFLFTAHRFHIYFRFLDYFSVHKLLQDFNQTHSRKKTIIRLSGSDNYHFPEFDQSLFPEVEMLALDHLDDVRTCFKKVILVPKSYATVLFQCKSGGLQTKCNHCEGKGLKKTQINLFRERVLKACSVSDHRRNGEKREGNYSITLVSRKAYLRNGNDKTDNFQRVLDNEDELIDSLKKAFSNSTVHVVHLESLGLCEQIRIVHNSDVYLGVHGAGLVHLWWLEEDALVYEMEPQYESNNPTFRSLARLSGRKYKSSYITGGLKVVHADASDVVNDLKNYFSSLEGQLQ